MTGKVRSRSVPLWRLYLMTLPPLLILAFLSWHDNLTLLDHVWLDALMRNRPADRKTPDPRVVLVMITDETRDVLKLPPAIPRALYASYIRRVHELGARAQLIDMFLSPSNDKADEDQLLRAADEVGNVAFIGLPIQKLDRLGRARSRLMKPVSGRLSRPQDHVAHTQLYSDAAGTARSFPLTLQMSDGDVVPHLAWVGVQLAHPEASPEFFPEAPPGSRPWHLRSGGVLRVGERWIPTIGPHHLLLFDIPRDVEPSRPGIHDGDLFEVWTFEDLMTFNFRTARPFEGSVVLLGTSQLAQHDRFLTPLDWHWGPTLNALALTGLLDGSFLLPLGGHVVIGLCALVWALGVPLYRGFSPLRSTLVGLATVGLLLGVAAFLYYRSRLWLPVAAPVLVNLASMVIVVLVAVRNTERERRFIRDTFSRYAPREVVDRLLAGGRLRLGGEAQVVTILFADINGFSAISEQQSPEETIDMLNEYFARMTTVIFRREGLIKQFVGDEILVIFGAPVYQEDHAARALATAWDMRQETERLRAEREAAGRPGYDVKFGINSGTVVLGNIGSPERMEYGAVGDVVNAASRIMGLNKEVQAETKILLGEQTAALAGNAWSLSEVGKFSVKGKSEALLVYSLAGPAACGQPAGHP